MLVIGNKKILSTVKRAHKGEDIHTGEKMTKDDVSGESEDSTHRSSPFEGVP